LFKKVAADRGIPPFCPVSYADLVNSGYKYQSRSGCTICVGTSSCSVARECET